MGRASRAKTKRRGREPEIRIGVGPEFLEPREPEVRIGVGLASGTGDVKKEA